MKKILLSAMFSAFALMSFNATADTLVSHGSVNFNWTILQQKIYEPSGSTELSTNKTTKTSKSTNIVSTTTSAVNPPVSFGDADLLKLLANSFKTNFPALSQLVTDGYSVYVVDKTGTNIILRVSTVLFVNFEDYQNAVYTSSDIETQTITKSGSTYSGAYTATVTSFVSLTYDDSGMTTEDGTTTTFHFYGLSSTANDSTYSSTSDTDHQNFNLTGGAGSGMIRGKFSIIKGNITGSAKGTYVD